MRIEFEWTYRCRVFGPKGFSHTAEIHPLYDSEKVDVHLMSEKDGSGTMLDVLGQYDNLEAAMAGIQAHAYKYIMEECPTLAQAKRELREYPFGTGKRR